MGSDRSTIVVSKLSSTEGTANLRMVELSRSRLRSIVAVPTLAGVNVTDQEW